MRKRLMFLRGITATVLFFMLAKANVWADTNTHLVLAVGYRTFLICAPLFISLGLTFGILASISLGLVSLIGCFFGINSQTLGAFALSMAVVGYLTKYITSNTSEGAADNKVALNIGSLVSGILIMANWEKSHYLAVCSALLFICFIIALKTDWKYFEKIEKSQQAVLKAKNKNSTYFPHLLGWSLVGVATGIKLTGIFAILPQYLLNQSGNLPPWYGSLLIVNSLGVVFAQHKILKFLDKTPEMFTHLSALSTLLLLSLPSVMRTEYLATAVSWVCLLTLGECALSKYDKIAKEDGYLFPKEIMVGVGSFLTVWLSRTFVKEIYLSGLLGCVCLSSGLALLFLVGRKTPSTELKGEFVKF